MSARDVRNVWIVSIVMALHAVAAEEESRIKPGHNLLQEADHRPAICPGDRLERMSFKDVTGKSYYLEDVTARGPTVFAFLSTKCPLAKRYTSRLIRLHDAYASRGVSLFAVFPNRDETDTGIKEYVEAARYSFPAVRDVGGYVARRLGATMTPQVFVVDQLQVLRYRGAIDDNRYETRVREQYLVDALDTILAKGRVMTPMVDAIGCSIHARTQPGKGTITYAGHIARILQDNCQSCHRSGQVAPFALTDYQEALQWQTEIKEYTRARLMPPWKAARGYGDFKNDIGLTDEEIGLISNWVDQGAPMGNRDDMPPSPRFKGDWAYGQPDLVVEMPEEYIIGPEGEDDYRHFIVPYKNAKHRFVEAVDVRPGNRSVVHHVIAYVDTTGQARTLDAADPGPGYTRFGDVGFQPASVIGGWAPGNLPARSPEGSGHWLPKECDIVLQVHYYRTGLEERDRTRVGVYFAKARRPVPVRRVMAINTRFVVPAGKKRHEVHAECKIEESSYLFAVTPHMHLIGETMQVTAHCPDGTTIPIVKIDDWDFNWQTAYHCHELQHLPSGTRVRLVATFDNSAANPNNPNNPPVDVGWGEKTTDEMCIAFLELLREAEYDPKAVAEN